MEEAEVVEFNIDTVTVEEAIDLEDALGIPWMDCISTKAGSAKVMRGFVWLAKRRSDPTLKLEDVHFNIQQFGEAMGQRAEGEDGSDPLEVSDPSEMSSKSLSMRSTESVPGSSNGSPSVSSNDAAPVSQG